MAKRILSFTLNGRAHAGAASDNALLLDYLRETAGATGTKTGCDGGECGACTVLLDDRPVLSCLTLAAKVEGRRVDTIESLAANTRPGSGPGEPGRGPGPENAAGRLSAIQRGFHEKLGAQCGYCTPGLVMASEGLLRANPDPDEAAIREALGSNICRCTGYVKIIEAVRHAAVLLKNGEKAA